jgi:Protein of unknown function (DUF2471)
MISGQKGSRLCADCTTRAARNGCHTSMPTTLSPTAISRAFVGYSRNEERLRVVHRDIWQHQAMPILDPASRENDDPGSDPIRLDRAVQRAAADLQRIVGTLVHYDTGQHRRARPATRMMCWPPLLELEEQSFSDLGSQSRHDKAIVDGLLRLRNSRLPGANIDEAVDWRRDDEQLPAVYVIVRALVEGQTEPGSEA